MAELPAHVFDERATRLQYAIVDRELTKHDPRLAWCGTRMSSLEWSYVDANHVLNAIRSDGPSPCIECLRKMMEAITGVEFSKIDLEAGWNTAQRAYAAFFGRLT